MPGAGPHCGLGCLAVKYIFCCFVLKAVDHENMVTRTSCYINRCLNLGRSVIIMATWIIAAMKKTEGRRGKRDGQAPGEHQGLQFNNSPKETNVHLHFDCFSGVSGDMTLGALMDLGVAPDWLAEELRGLTRVEFELATETVFRNGIRAVRAIVSADEEKAHRHHAQIRDIIQAAPFSDGVKTRSLAIFARIAQAEGAIHGCDPEKIHFHEVGGIDAMVDIVGTALGLERLGVTSISCSPVPLGSGFVACRHGTLPVPAPATAAILKGIPVYGADTGKEMVTPTGAAIVAESASAFGPMPTMAVRGIGYGAGTHELKDRPNLLRLFYGKAEPEPEAEELPWETVCMVEANIDDMNPEIFGHLMETLLTDGALDVWWTPVQMKKNRPGTLIQVLCAPERRAATVRRLLMETTTLGVRHREMRRTALAREAVTVDTPFGPVAAKRVRGLDGRSRLVPEYEACRNLAEKLGRPLREIYDALGAVFTEKAEG